VIAETESVSLPIPHPSAAFDAIAQDYDRIFTHSRLGSAHRSLVHERLRRYLRKGQRILDLNCGTGEDAVYLASLGMCVVACDISECMIDIAGEKAAHRGYVGQIEFAVCANERLSTLGRQGSFDAVLSNFGGLNCTEDLHGVARQLSRLVRPGGRLFLCLIGRVCAWEIVWYAARAKWRKAFRRLDPRATRASVGGESVYIHYPSRRDMKQAFGPWLRLESWRGIGIVLPPSWLAYRFESRPRLVNLLRQVDRGLGAVPALRGLADHVLFEFVREEK